LTAADCLQFQGVSHGATGAILIIKVAHARANARQWWHFASAAGKALRFAWTYRLIFGSFGRRQRSFEEFRLFAFELKKE
jgi:hypothetical protein